MALEIPRRLLVLLDAKLECGGSQLRTCLVNRTRRQLSTTLIANRPASLESSLGRVSRPRSKVLAIVMSWPGQMARAGKIAQNLSENGVAHFVIHSHTGLSETSVPKDWIEMSETSFFGAKFFESLRLFSEYDCTILMQIQADVGADDWGPIISQCEKDFQNYQDLAVWGPTVEGGNWELEAISRGAGNDSECVRVMFVEAIVWAISRKILDRAISLPIHHSPLGYGIDLAVGAIANSANLESRICTTFRVNHPPGTGYSNEDAIRQGEALISQLPWKDKLFVRRIQNQVRKKRLAMLSARDRVFLSVPDPIRKAIRNLQNPNQ